MPLTFDRSFRGSPGEPVVVAPGVTRILAPNPGPFTFHGTNTYLVGERELAVLDPGPDDPAHVEAILRAVAGRPVGAILVTHTHRDHSPAAAALKARTGAPTYGEGPHRPSRPVREGERAPTEAGGDPSFVPDIRIGDGATVSGNGWQFAAVATPGHTANHLAFAFGEGLLFCGDHVMAWSTTVVAPPDGAMADYMASLEKLIERGDRLLLPGHGEAIADVPERLAGLREHRLERAAAVREGLRTGPQTIPALVARIYPDLDAALRPAAGLSTRATLEWLMDLGEVAREPGRTDDVFRLA